MCKVQKYRAGKMNVFTPRDDLDLFNIADWLFFETLLLEIRGKTISYATFKKRQRVDRQALLQLEIQELENAGNLKCYSL